MSGSVNINTSGAATTTIGNILSTTNISGSSINISGSVNINTTGSATTTIGNGTVNINTTGNGNTTIGNATTSTYTAIESNGISIGKQLSGTGYIDIGGQANTTTGYIVVGSTSLDSLYLKAKNIYLFNPFTPSYSTSPLNNNSTFLGGFRTTSIAIGPIDLYSSSKLCYKLDNMATGLYLLSGQFVVRGPSATPYFSFYLVTTTSNSWNSGDSSGVTGYIMRTNVGGSNTGYRYSVGAQQDISVTMCALSTTEAGSNTFGVIIYSDQNNNNYVSGSLTAIRIG